VAFVVDKAAVGQVFSKHYGFLCHSFRQLLHTQHQSSPEAGTTSQIVANVPNEISLMPPQ
jgi:hypothetical protein